MRSSTVLLLLLLLLNLLLELPCYCVRWLKRRGVLYWCLLLLAIGCASPEGLLLGLVLLEAKVLCLSGAIELQVLLLLLSIFSLYCLLKKKRGGHHGGRTHCRSRETCVAHECESCRGVTSCKWRHRCAPRGLGVQP